MKDSIYSSEIPMGLGVALAQNLPAMNHFASLSQEGQRRIIDKTHTIRSKKEMRQFVESLVNAGHTQF